MIQNYLKIAFRNLWRGKLYTVLNMLGLGIGIATLVWAYLNYRFSFSFDNFHPDRERVFRVMSYKEGGKGIRGICPAPLAQTAQQELAGIEETVRIDSRGLSAKAAGSEAFDQRVHFVDPSFFKVFHFALETGSNDLSDKNSILITQDAATKYFGQENPLGKTLLLYAGETYQVSLVVKGSWKIRPSIPPFPSRC